MELAKEGEGSAINMDDFQITLSSGTSVVSFKRRRFDDGEETEQERMEMKEIKLDMWKMKKDLMDGKEDMKKEIQKMHQMKKEIQEAREELTADRNKLEEDRKIFERVECEREKLRKDQARNEEECQRIRMEADRQIEEKLGELSKSRENLQQSWRDLPPNDQVPDPQPVQVAPHRFQRSRYARGFARTCELPARAPLAHVAEAPLVVPSPAVVAS